MKGGVLRPSFYSQFVGRGMRGSDVMSCCVTYCAASGQYLIVEDTNIGSWNGWASNEDMFFWGEYAHVCI